MAAAPMPNPLVLTVVVPAHRCAGTLREALIALRASDLPPDRWELIVVDDASGDGTPSVAAEYADRVVALTGAPRGPAYARNRGAEAARGKILVFVDADVCVHRPVLRGFADLFAAHPDVGAAFGAYDTRPAAPGLVSQYRNLVHHYVHARHPGDAATFWAGCGAVRRDLFARLGGFDEQRYARPQIEDIELGHRIDDAGWRILLRPELQGTHLKRWTLRGGLVTDVRDRGLPWVELLLTEGRGRRASALNLQPAEKVYTALVGLAGLLLVVAVARRDAWSLAASGVCLAAVVGGNLPLLRWLARERGPTVAVAAIPLRLLYYVMGGVCVLWGGARHLLGGPRRRRCLQTVPRIAAGVRSPQLGR